jgi:drug/metabolite transporter (DMT)-like permease
MSHAAERVRASSRSLVANRMLVAYLALLAGVLCIGFAGIFTRWGHAPGVVVAAWRVGLATVVLAIPMARQPANRRRISRHALLWTVFGGVMFALDMGIWNASMDYTTAANATFMGNTAPLWVGLATVFLLRKRLPRLFWPGIAIALTGAALMIFSNGGDVSVRQGDLMALLAAIFWAGYQLSLGHVRSNASVSNLSSLWIVAATGSVLLVPVTLMSGFPLVGYDRQTMLALLGAGLVSQIGGYLGINYALGHIPAARVSVVILLQPVIAAVAAAVLLGEPFGGWRLVGGALVLAGVYLVTIAGREKRAGRRAPDTA